MAIDRDTPLDETYDWRSRLPVLSGAIVCVREIAETDAISLHESLTDREVKRYTSSLPPTVDTFRGFIAWCHLERKAGRSLCFAVVPNGRRVAVGIFQVRTLEPTFFTAEWGFAIGRPFWSTGVVEEAAALVAGFAFEVLHVHRLEGRAAAANGRGNGALQKLGARAEGVLARSLRRRHEHLDQFLWALRAEDLQEHAARHERFSQERTRARVMRMIAEANRQHHSSREGVSREPALYRFVITASIDDDSDE